MDKAKNVFLKAGNFIKTKVSSLSKKAIIGILAITAAVIVSIVVLSIILGQTRYAVLFTGVSSSEQGEIIKYAKETLGITDIKLNEKGDILVNEKQVEEARVGLSMANYPSTGYNYDIWKNGVTLFSSKTEMRELQKQQLENNLSATLRFFDNVDSALVTLNIPENDNYVLSTSEQESSAGIALKLKNDLTPLEIDGMYNLVANSVPGLKRTNITITDQTGMQLLPDLQSSDAEEESKRIQLEYQRMAFQDKMRVQLENAIKTVMMNTFDDINVSVGLLLNYDKQVSEVIEYTGPNKDENGNMMGIISDETFKNAFGGIAKEGGVIGTFINSDISPDYPTLTVDEGDQFYSETSRQLNYKVNEEKKQIEKNGASIDRLSAAVVVKSNSTLTTEEENRWRNIIANAIGADVDYVSIKPAPFIETTNPPIDNTPFGISNISSQSIALLAIIIVLGIILIVLLILALNAPGSRKKRRAAAAANAPAVTAQGAGADELEFQNKEKIEIPDMSNTEFEIPSLTDEVPETRDEALKREIQDFSKNNPEIVAQLIRTWIRGDE